MIGKAKEGDYVWFDISDSPYLRLCFQVSYVDDEWVYLRCLSEKESNYKAHRRSGQLRYFDKLGWDLVPGSFDRICEE